MRPSLLMTKNDSVLLTARQRTRSVYYQRFDCSELCEPKSHACVHCFELSHPNEIMSSESSTTHTAVESVPLVQAGTQSQPPAQKRQPTCGPVLDSIAGDLRLHPYDVTLAIAAMLGNIAGPHAGFVTPDGELVKPGLNVLQLEDGGSTTHAFPASLVQPLRARVQMIRERAAGHNRLVVDHHVFGVAPASLDKIHSPEFRYSMEMRAHELSGFQEKLLAMKDIPLENFNYYGLGESWGNDCTDTPWAAGTPGINHLPSLFAERLEINQVPVLLQESLHREAFLYMPAGGMFGRADLFSSKQEEQAVRLSALLHGQDMRFPPLHPHQGHGTFATARTSLWGSTDLERIGSIVSRADSSWNDVLRQCLLWSCTDLQAGQTSIPQVPRARDEYVLILHKLLDLRCHGTLKNQCRIALHRSEVDSYRELRGKILDRIDQADVHDRSYLVQFHDLFERLLWVLMQFASKEHPFHYDMCAARLALHALKSQQRALKQAREKAQEARLRVPGAVILSVLSRKGPLTFRDIQRASNNQRKSELMPGLELLIQRGRVQQDTHHRYGLVSHDSNPPGSLASSSPTTLTLPQ